jgi:hypothetical protein
MNETTHTTEDAGLVNSTTTANAKGGEAVFVQVEAFPGLVSPPDPAPPGKRHNLALINKLLDRYGLAIDDKMSTVKIKSFWRYLSAGAWKGKK